MKTQLISCVLFVLALIVAQASCAQQPALLPPVVTGDAAVKDQPKQKDKDKAKEKDKDKAPDKKLTVPPKTDFFPVDSAIGNFPTFFNPGMMGDWQDLFARRQIATTGTQSTVTRTGNFFGQNVVTTVTTPVTGVRTVVAPNPNRGGFNIAEAGESAMPQDRVFGSWNSYSGVGYGPSRLNAPLTTVTTTQTVINPPRGVFAPIVATTTTTTTTVLPGAPRVDVNREMFGFEKTFLDGYASIEVRAPLAQQGGAGEGFGVNDFGEVTVIGKYALFMDRSTGNVFSTGLAITFPSGQSIATADGNFRDTLFQPFIGYIWNFDRFYIQGFNSIVVPTDKNDVALAFNSLGLNYWLYRSGPDRMFSYVVPAFEVHVTTPLNHRDLNGPIVVPDTVALTAGINIGIFRNTTLSLAAAVPVTGPRPYSIEGMMYLNVRY